MIELDSQSTALLLIDLQKGILGNRLIPTTGEELLARGQALAERFRAAKATVVLVNVTFSADGGDMLRQRVDESMAISSVAEGHEMSVKHILPRLARLVQSGDITLIRT